MTLIGANGAGKSTTLRSINGLNHPRTGTISFMGEDITHAPAHEIVKLGISQSPEGRRLFPRMSVDGEPRDGRVPAAGHAEIEKDMEHVFTLFPRLQERSTRRPGRSPAASSRCARSVAR